MTREFKGGLKVGQSQCVCLCVCVRSILIDSTRPKLIRGAEGQSSNRSVTNLSRHLGLTCPALLDKKELHHILEALSSLSMWSLSTVFSKNMCFQSFFLFYLAPCEAMPLRCFHCHPPSDLRVIKVRKMCLKLSSYPAG